MRDAEALERFAKVDTLIVDKTGTLTEGKPNLTDIVPASGVDGIRLLSLAASLERGSEHPLAEAIVAGAQERGASLVDISGFAAKIGKGVEGSAGDTAIALGNAAMMADLGVATDALQAETGASAR